MVDRRLPEGVLALVAQHLELKQRATASCACRAWRRAAATDGDTLAATCGGRSSNSCPPHLLHLALETGRAQRLAATSPLARLTLSASLSCHASTAALLSSATRLRALTLEAAGGAAAALLLAVARLPPSLTHVDLLLLSSSSGSGGSPGASSGPSGSVGGPQAATAEPWSREALAALAGALAAAAPRLRALALRCGAPAFFADGGAALEPLAALTALTSLSLGPAPAAAGAAPGPPEFPLGFDRAPAFVSRLPALVRIDLHLAESAAAPLVAQTFDGVAAVPEVALVLRADRGTPRVVACLPTRLPAVTGLTRLAVQSFVFEDAGGWACLGRFDAAPLAALPHLSDLGLLLRTWGCDHLDALSVDGLPALTQLRRLLVTVTGAPRTGEPPRGGPGGVMAGGAAGCGLQEVRIALPCGPGAGGGVSSNGGGGGGGGGGGCEEIELACGGVLVVRGSRALARARGAAALARALVFEEDAPAGADGGAGAGGGAAAAPAAMAVRAPAAVVVGALPELWPGAQVWEGPLLVVSEAAAAEHAAGRAWWRRGPPESAVSAQLLCSGGPRDAALARLQGVLSQGAAGARWGRMARVCGK